MQADKNVHQAHKTETSCLKSVNWLLITVIIHYLMETDKHSLTGSNLNADGIINIYS